MRNGFGFFLLLLGVLAAPAQAAFVLCNKTGAAIEAAFGYREQQEWNSRGWWVLQPEECKTIQAEPLTERYYYYYARSQRGSLQWTGPFQFCAADQSFQVRGDKDCAARSYRVINMAEIDVGDLRSYTLSFLEK